MSGSNFDYETYQREREAVYAARMQEAREEQQAIDAITDPAAQLEARRARYTCRQPVTLADLPTWSELAPQLIVLPNNTTATAGGGGGGFWSSPNDKIVLTPKDVARRRSVDAEFNSKLSVMRGDITALEVDAIVNAANESLLGGGGIDGAIHSAAGPLLVEECRPLDGCATGSTKMTKGYSLPARHVLHTVGPMGRGDALLRGCYESILALVDAHDLTSVGFCCVGTGIFGFPLVRATHIALRCVRDWMERWRAEDPSRLARIQRLVFVTFKASELEAYERILPSYFPVDGLPAAACAPEDDDAIGPEPPAPAYGRGAYYY
jgi:O-acetyl-ADP-ribose deacetylase